MCVKDRLRNSLSDSSNAGLPKDGWYHVIVGGGVGELPSLWMSKKALDRALSVCLYIGDNLKLHLLCHCIVS